MCYFPSLQQRDKTFGMHCVMETGYEKGVGGERLLGFGFTTHIRIMDGIVLTTSHSDTRSFLCTC